jgi:hypothetical protein
VLAGVLWFATALGWVGHSTIAAAGSGDRLPSEQPRVVSAPKIRSVSAPTIRVVSARGIEPISTVREPTHAAPPNRPANPAPHDKPVALTREDPVATPLPQLPAPHWSQSAQPPEIHLPPDLRKLVGRRDKHTPFAAVVGWAHALGTVIGAADGKALVAWARDKGRLASNNDGAQPGDLLVFDHVESDATSDLVAIVIARDNRNVLELLYLGGGVIRRGFCDPKHPSVRRDHGIVVNTYLRTGNRYPPKGTHYLAGELLSHVVSAR